MSAGESGSADVQHVGQVELDRPVLVQSRLGAAGRNIITVRNVGFRFDVLPEWITGHPGLVEEGRNQTRRS
jgi:hypothetical protein